MPRARQPLTNGRGSVQDCNNAQYTKGVQMRKTTALTLIAKALTLPLRERMLWMLGDRERCGCEFAPELGVDPSVVSRHLAVLQRAGLVSSRRDGARVLWTLTDPAILRVLEKLTGLVREREAVR